MSKIDSKLQRMTYLMGYKMGDNVMKTSVAPISNM